MGTISQIARVLAPTLRWLRTHIGLCIALIAFVGVAGLYARRTPFFEMPGELWHYRRVQTFLGTGLPPGLSFLDEAPIAPQADRQPPLYYALGALLVAPLDVASDPAVYQPNPFAVLGEPDGIGNRNVVIAMTPPRADGPLARALLRLRYLAIVAAAATLALVYLVFLRLTQGRTLTSLAALIGLAFLPGYLFMTGGINNRALGLFFCILAAYLSLRMADVRQSSPWLRWGAALAAGLAALTSWWGWCAVILVAYTLAVCAKRIRLERQELARSLAPHVVAMLALALGPLLQLWLRQRGAESQVVWQSLVEMDLLSRAQMALRAYWGLFGWLNIPADAIYYTTVAILMALSISGLALQAVQARWLRGPGTPWRVKFDLTLPRYGVALVWMALGVVVFVASVLSPATSFLGGALLPLAPGLSLLTVLGLEAWIRRRYAPVILALLLLAFAAVSVIAPFVYIAPAYAAPPRLDLDELPVDLRALDVTLGPELFLLGYRVDDSAMEPGGVLKVELFWLARRRIATDYTAHLTVLGCDGALVASHMSYLGGGIRPTSLWVPGDVVVDRLHLRVAEDATAPTAADVRLSIYAEPGAEPVPGVDPHGNPLGGNIRVTQARLAAPVRVGYVPEQRVQANLDNEISLVGYGLSPLVPVAGETLRIILYWRSEGPLIRDYTVFIHLVDPQGELVTQIDSPPLQGSYPTSFWAMGEQVRDVHHMPLPASLLSGEYRLRVGLYRLETGERLVVLDSDPPQDYVAIGPINIP
jgi:hypothetical protein